MIGEMNTVAFYPDQPMWVGDFFGLHDFLTDKNIGERIREDVVVYETPDFTIRISRDGRICMMVSHLYAIQEKTDFYDASRPYITEVNAKYLEYINCFLFLLTSVQIEDPEGGLPIHSWIKPQEVTEKDIFQAHYIDGLLQGETLNTGSWVGSIQRFRHSQEARETAIKTYDHTLVIRQEMPITLVKKACHQFEHAFRYPELRAQLVAFSKATVERRRRNYSISVALSWFLTEALLKKLWAEYVHTRGQEQSNVSTRINAKRRKFLHGLSIAVISNMLELEGVIDTRLFNEIDKVRGLRNDVVHESATALTEEDAKAANSIAHKLIEKVWDFSFTHNYA